MAGEKFYVAISSVDALLLMKGREAVVKTVVQELGLVDYRNSYTKTFHEDLVTLLCDPPAAAFVRKYWEQHITKGTNLTRTKPDANGSMSFEPLHQLLTNTSAVVSGVLKALELDSGLTMDTKLPPGNYLYAIGFLGQVVIKVGKVCIAESNAPEPQSAPGGKGKSKGPGLSRFFTVGDRFKGHLKSLKLPVEFNGSAVLEEMELLRIVPAPHGERNECWVQCQLRDYAKKPVERPFLQCKTPIGGTSEFFDARLTGYALDLMNQVAQSPNQCTKGVGEKIAWNNEDSSPVEEQAQEEPQPSLPAMPSFPAVAAAGPKPISAPYKCKIVWELENGKTKDRGFLLTPAQIVSKNRMVVQFFEALNYL